MHRRWRQWHLRATTRVGEGVGTQPPKAVTVEFTSGLLGQQLPWMILQRLTWGFTTSQIWSTVRSDLAPTSKNNTTVLWGGKEKGYKSLTNPGLLLALTVTLSNHHEQMSLGQSHYQGHYILGTQGRGMYQLGFDQTSRAVLSDIEEGICYKDWTLRPNWFGSVKIGLYTAGSWQCQWQAVASASNGDLRLLWG